jgi:hypothetical protein
VGHDEPSTLGVAGSGTHMVCCRGTPHTSSRSTPMPLTPEQRRLRAQAAAHARWAKESAVRQAQLGQNGLIEKFARDVDPDGVLDEKERYRRAESARRAHMLRMSLASSKARAARKAQGEEDVALAPAPTPGAGQSPRRRVGPQRAPHRPITSTTSGTPTSATPAGRVCPTSSRSTPPSSALPRSCVTGTG